MIQRSFGRVRKAFVVALILVGTAGILVGIAGCGNPCGQLADRTCRRLGEKDPLCEQLRGIAADPRVGDSHSCEAGNTFVDELQRSR